MHIVEFCVSNMHHGTDKVLERLEQDPRIEVIEYGCLGNCGECYLSPYALVNGESVVAESADQLFDLIQQEIDKQEADKAALDKLLDDL
ncbi:YuzB family protein [Cohnella candidum]|uniref:DUF1450 domain-containing protein n=1 Tax=Cohnella candidum TaxID=2674991 RepID=A0A3G3JTZ9_9BACL|nr:YuzB family protein [Cohnella candidum]AYQ71367.1 DUF1450 domain-containing protein [Cohnella candidum]